MVTVEIHPVGSHVPTTKSTLDRCVNYHWFAHNYCMAPNSGGLFSSCHLKGAMHQVYPPRLLRLQKPIAITDSLMNVFELQDIIFAASERSEQADSQIMTH